MPFGSGGGSGVQGITSSGGPITLAPGLAAGQAEVTINAPTGAKANADEILGVYDDLGVEVFGVDGVGGVNFTMSTAPFTGRTSFVGPLGTFFTIGPTLAGHPGIAPTGAALNPITGGALPTVTPVSGTMFRCSSDHDVTLVVPVTYNPGVATTATCKVELSPDDQVTYSTLVTITKPPGTVFDGSIEPLVLPVPKLWCVKLTAVNATLGTGTYY